jgi:hypothetical protein
MSEPGMHARVGGQLLTGPTYVREAGVLEPVTVEVKPETSLAYLESLTDGDTPLAWYDAEHVNGLGAAQPVHGDTLSSWQDLSGNGWHLLQNTAANRPTFRTSGYGITLGMPAAVEFDGAGDTMAKAGLPMTAAVTLYEAWCLANEIAAGETEVRAFTLRRLTGANEGAWLRAGHTGVGTTTRYFGAVSKETRCLLPACSPWTTDGPAHSPPATPPSRTTTVRSRPTSPGFRSRT